MKYLILFLISFNLFAGTMPNNDYTVGDGAVTTEKGFTFDTGDGASNVNLKVNDSRDLIFSGNKYQIGDGSSSNNKEFIFDPTSATSLKWNGSDNYVELRSENIRIGKDADNDIKLEFGKGGSNPFLGYDSVKGKLIFSNDGTAEKVIGSGSGSGGGENFNNGFTADDNANAEDGTTGWTASAGTFSATSTDPLEGDQSFTWTPAAQNDTLDSPVLDFDKDIFLGRSCQANIEYIGGDDNLTLQVINADNDVLGSEVLKAHSISAIESVFFLCPSSTATANQKDLRLRLINAGATASALIKFDKSYVGTLIGLTETTLPDTLVAEVSTVAAGNNILSNESGVLDSVSGTVANRRVDFLLGVFTEKPAVNVTCNFGSAGSGSVPVWNISETGFNFGCVTNNGSSGTDSEALFTIVKKGSDAKQSVQVYKSIPKVSENVNAFVAKIDGTLSPSIVSDENANWINGDCVRNSTGNYTCNFISNLFSAAPNCRANPVVDANSSVSCVPISTSTSSINIGCDNTTGAANLNLNLECTRSTDFKMPIEQPIIVGQVANSYAESASKNVRVESCEITNSGTPATNNDLCNTWIASLTDNGTGDVIYTIEDGIFTKPPVCQCSAIDNTDAICSIPSSATNTSLRTRTWDASAGAAVDHGAYITCIGEK